MKRAICWKHLQHRCLPVNIGNFLRTAFFIKHLCWLLLFFTKSCWFSKLLSTTSDGRHLLFVGNKAKGQISKRVFQENKAFKFSEKGTFLTPWYARKKFVRFSENLACFVFLKHPFWDSRFCLITGVLFLRFWVYDYYE